MYDTLKRFGVLRWAGEDGENCVRTFGKILAMLVLVNIAIQMVCLWPVGILNLVGHNEKYWLTSNNYWLASIFYFFQPIIIIVLPHKVTFFTFYFIFIFYHNPFTPKPHCADPCPLYCLQAKGHQFKIHGQPFYHCWWSSACPPLCHSVQFTSSLSSHLLKPHCCFYRGPHKPVFISQSMP